MLRVERDQMISALAPDRPDQAFNISALPGRAKRGEPDEIFGRRVPRECFIDFARQTPRLWVGPPQTTTAAAVDGQEQEI